MTHRYFQPCDQANIGVGKQPDAECVWCEGRGFYYHLGWARTCSCKV
jgi:hypothetical protein